MQSGVRWRAPSAALHESPMSIARFTRRHLLAMVTLPSIGGAGSIGLAQPEQQDTAKPAGIIDDQFDVESPTALTIMQDGKLLAGRGDERRKVNVASVRKSLLGALYGIAIAEGRIDPSATLAELGIDDTAPGLTEAEKRATVRDLLQARSGIYHVAAYETADIRARRPTRGTHPPGAFWFYNNWDFNALGTIYRQQTGEDIFASFASRIARPTGMVDFTARDGRYIREVGSRHEAYPFKLSARDAARFGQLILDRGVFGGRQLVPADWIAESVTPHSRTDRGDLGYGYLWWTLPAASFGPGAAFAAGFGGQFIAVVPSRRLVVVQVIAGRPREGGGSTRRFVGFLRRLVAAS
jgi:CubicO group peptidase (beta-lactamase class C family)